MAAASWLVLVLVPACVCGYTPKYKYLDENCNTVVNLSKDVILEFSDYSVTSRKSCQMSFQNTDGSKQIQVRFRYLDIQKTSGPNCSRAGLVISEGSKYLTPPSGVCGTRKPSINYRTTGDMVTIALVNRAGPIYTDFQLLLTSFYDSHHNSSCRNEDFECNNGLCISNQLVCNGYNDCGDDTDEVEGCSLAAAVIVGIVFGVVIFVVLVSVLGIYVRRRRRAYLRITETVREYPTIQQPVSSGSYVPSYQQTGGYQKI